MVSAFGIGAFGHVVNDAFDVGADARAGKRNGLAAWAPWKRAVLAVVLLVCGFLPWILTPAPPLAVYLLAANAVVLVAYAAPPIRLKERGIWGVLADAIYAHLLPVAFVLALIDGPAPAFAAVWVIASLCWAFFFGIRGILIHQIWDVDNDARAELNTFVVRSGVDAARRLVRRLIYPLELLSLFVLGVSLVGLIPVSFSILAVYGACWWIGRAVGVFPSRLRRDPAPAERDSYVPLVSFYALWPAFAFALALLVVDFRYSPLLALLVLLFPATLWKQLVVTAHLFRGTGYQLYWIVRNFIQRRTGSDPASRGDNSLDSVRVHRATSGEAR